MQIWVVVEERRVFAKELAVWIDGAWEGVSEPVEGDVVEDLVDWWIIIGPEEEFFADPKSR